MTNELPVGIIRQSGNNKGFRLIREIGGKNYRFGSFQNYQHALLTNGYIDIITEDLREAQANAGLVPIAVVREMIEEINLANMKQINNLIGSLDETNEYRAALINKEVMKLKHQLDGRSIWGRMLGRDKP